MDEKRFGDIHVEMGDSNSVNHIGHVTEPPPPAVRQTIRESVRLNDGSYKLILDIAFDSKWPLAAVTIVASDGRIASLGLEIEGHGQIYSHFRFGRTQDGRPLISFPWRKAITLTARSRLPDPPQDALTITFE